MCRTRTDISELEEIYQDSCKILENKTFHATQILIENSIMKSGQLQEMENEKYDLRTLEWTFYG